MIHKTRNAGIEGWLIAAYVDWQELPLRDYKNMYLASSNITVPSDNVSHSPSLLNFA
jgi:hypothetical protein